MEVKSDGKVANGCLFVPRDFQSSAHHPATALDAPACSLNGYRLGWRTQHPGSRPSPRQTMCCLLNRKLCRSKSQARAAGYPTGSKPKGASFHQPPKRGSEAQLTTASTWLTLAPITLVSNHEPPTSDRRGPGPLCSLGFTAGLGAALLAPEAGRWPGRAGN